MSDTANRFEVMTEADEFYSYCLWPYKPVAPHVGKFRPVNLLYHSFGLLGADERMFELVERIRRAIGPSHTVYGVECVGEKMGWEFYFYDYRRLKRERSMTRIIKAVAPLVRCEIQPNESLPYFMFSIYVDNELVSSARELSEIHMYVGNPGSTVSSGICYSLQKQRTRLENFYFFFDPAKQLDEVIGKICCSPHVDFTKLDVDEIAWPELRNCTTICVANKQNNDCIYFSGIDVDQLLVFLRRMSYRKEIVSFVEANRHMLDHLRYDVGIDYRMEGEEVVLLKNGYYGIF